MPGFFDDPWWLCNSLVPACSPSSKRDITIQHAASTPLIQVIFPGPKFGQGYALTSGTDPRTYSIYFFEPDADFAGNTAHYVGHVITHSEPGGARTTLVQGRRVILQIVTVGGVDKVKVLNDDDWTSNRPVA